MIFLQAETFLRCTSCRRLTRWRDTSEKVTVPRCNPDDKPCIDHQPEVRRQIQEIP